MIDFKKLFGLGSSESERKERLGRLFSELEQLLEEHSDEEVKFIAGFSGLLGKVAYSDRRISIEELGEIKKILVEKTTISSKLYDAVLDLVKTYAEELCGIEDHNYTQILNTQCSKEEKIDILRALYAVAAADESIVIDEDRDISVIAKGLNLSHKEYITVRKEFEESLEVLKNFNNNLKN